MKIVFQDSIIDILSKRLYEGRAANKKAQYILLTNEEHQELRSDRRYFQNCDGGFANMRASDQASMRDAKFSTVELRDPDYPHNGARSPYMVFPCLDKFQGVPFAVVPTRFM